MGQFAQSEHVALVSLRRGYRQQLDYCCRWIQRLDLDCERGKRECLWTGANSDSYGHGFANANKDSDSNGNAHTNCDANANANANSMLGEMCTHAEDASKLDSATHSASSFNAAAYRFPERDPGTATHSSTSSDTAADAYRFATSYSEATPVSRGRRESRCA